MSNPRSERPANRIFTTEALDEEFAQRGYVVIPFLDAGTVAAVQAIHDRLFPVVPTDFHSTFLSTSPEQRLQVLTEVRKIVSQRLKTILPFDTLRLATFITKRPTTERGSLPLHRDAWMSDHDHEVAPTVWVPLVDVGPHNACMRVVPCSHRLCPDPHPMNAHISAQVEQEFIRDVPMRAGMALVYDSRLVHGSGENLTAQPRVAFQCIMIADGHEPRLYFLDKREGRMNVLEVTESFLCQFQYGVPPETPYPDGVRLLATIDGVGAPQPIVDSAALKRLQTEAVVETGE